MATGPRLPDCAAFGVSYGTLHGPATVEVSSVTSKPAS